MSAPRIGDKQLGAQAARGTTADSRFLTRAAAAAASPLGVLLLVPGIVLGSA